MVRDHACRLCHAVGQGWPTQCGERKIWCRKAARKKAFNDIAMAAECLVRARNLGQWWRWWQ